nr:MAG TPA_asm: hypothetical protein [Caudoviricetes sp.]
MILYVFLKVCYISSVGIVYLYQLFFYHLNHYVS